MAASLEPDRSTLNKAPLMRSMRLDEAMVARGLSASRARARDAILRGTVQVDGQPARKPAQPVTSAMVISIADPAAPYVSRAALKLVHALEVFDIPVRGVRCLDVGASTGGFTQVLLRHGAAHVVAVDVGHGQLHPSLASHPRLTLLEGLNARDLAATHLGDPPALVVCDVSFISLKLALVQALALSAAAASLVALIKPQFEVGRAALPMDGVVKDEALQRAVCTDICQWLQIQGWVSREPVASPLLGGNGNREFLLYAHRA